MNEPELTASTIRYLFASEWAPRDDSNWAMHVPDAKVAGPDTAGNLLNLAIWSLQEQGLVEVQQLRPCAKEKVSSMGGRSFTRIAALDQGTKLPGLEGAVLTRARERAEEGALGRIDDALAKFVSGDDERGIRGVVLALDLHSYSPWTTVAGLCQAEAVAAGLVEVKGRMFKKPVISDPAALEALVPRDAEIVAARRAYRERNEELDNAVIGDCLHAVYWAHTGSRG